MLISKGYSFAQKIVIDVMPVNQIVIITDNTNFANHFNINSKFFLEFTSDCSVQIFPCFYSTACSFNKCSLTKSIISPSPAIRPCLQEFLCCGFWGLPECLSPPLSRELRNAEPP